jgi:hypothetical protein
MRVVCFNSTQRKIDLFTQKEPYSGKGSNVPSDAFGPGELVILYALVTEDELSLQNLLVTFYVQGPDGTSFGLTEKTNASGIATINFTIPYKCDNVTEVFGKWFTLANVLISDNLFQDTLTFEVNWIVKLISVRTMNGNLTYQTDFGIGGYVGVEITLRNIANCIKSTMLVILIKDELEVPVNYLEIHDFKVQPNEKLIFLYCKLYLPKWSHVGMAKIIVSALDASTSEGGVAYCPPVSTFFYIMPYNPLAIAFHDVAIVEVVPSATSVEVGQLLSVSVILRNEGTEVESFNVSAQCGSLSIGFSEVSGLLPYSEKLLEFTLNTSLLDVGNYTIVVSIPYLMKEADLTDNVFVDGIVEVKPKKLIHNIAIIDLDISKNSVYIGELLEINVSVLNKGNETETFDVQIYHDSLLIETLPINSLMPSALTSLIFVWNTSFVHVGHYQISASAPLEGDIDVSDNTFFDGVVEVKARLPPVHDIAVLDVVPSSSLVYAGELLNVNVTLKNKGSEYESFNVTLYYDSNVVDTLQVEEMPAGAQHTRIFHWNTHGVSAGNYTLSAYAEPVLGEEYTEDNRFENGVVRVVEAPKGWFVPWWFWWLLLLLLIFLILLAIWLYYRRKRKRNEKAFYSGWTAWYYCYDLRNRFRIITKEPKS